MTSIRFRSPWQKNGGIGEYPMQLALQKPMLLSITVADRQVNEKIHPQNSLIAGRGWLALLALAS